LQIRLGGPSSPVAVREVLGTRSSTKRRRSTVLRSAARSSAATSCTSTVCESSSSSRTSSLSCSTSAAEPRKTVRTLRSWRRTFSAVTSRSISFRHRRDYAVPAWRFISGEKASREMTPDGRCRRVQFVLMRRGADSCCEGVSHSATVVMDV